VSVAVITGAARRVGAGLAAGFARDGHRVVLHANTSLAEASALCGALNAEGCDTLALQADLSALGGADAFYDRLMEAAGPPDILVNNASAFQYDFPGAASEEILRDSLSIHVQAPIRIMELAARRKRPGQRVTVFNILDQKLDNPNPDYFSYTIGKAGLRAATTLWQSLGREDFRVFGILPGLIYPSGAQSEARFAEDALKTPLRRAVSPSDIYAAMRFFINNDGLPGQDLAVDGGESLTARARDVAFE